MITISYALKNEINHFKRYLNIINEHQMQNIKFHEGKIGEMPILLVQTGVGIKNSKAAIKIAINNYEVDLLISTGFAGALRNAINVGDIVFAKDILYSKDLKEVENEKHITEIIKIESKRDYAQSVKTICNELALSFHYGDTITVDKVISSAAKKKCLGNNSTAITVDMETFAIAETASNKRIPFISVRSVSDDVESDLNIENINDILEAGEVNLKKTSWKLIKNVQTIPHLMKLRKQTIVASRNLAKLLLSFVKNFVKSDLILG